ncbi:MAG: M28 family peptidase, partial [Planctomycetes bacterium]|nr:M28 family peptidase [Planctomycetota bacterium]
MSLDHLLTRSLMLLCLSAAPLTTGELRGDETAAGEKPESARTIETIVRLGREDNEVMSHLDYLVNNIGARLTGSDNDHKACEWAKSQFEKWGLTHPRLEEAGSFPVEFNRGPWSGRMISPEPMALELGTAAWSAGTRGAVRGEAILAPTSSEGLSAADYAGKWVFSERRRGRRSRDEQQEAREIRTFLDEAGVAGFVSPGNGKYIRTGGRSPETFDERPTTPRITLLEEQWNQIHERLEKGEKVELEFDIRNHFEPGPAVYYNVIAEIPGTEFPDECVIIGGHIDSWDGATGTTDNGCGVAVAMEAARLLAQSGAR